MLIYYSGTAYGLGMLLIESHAPNVMISYDEVTKDARAGVRVARIADARQESATAPPAPLNCDHEDLMTRRKDGEHVEVASHFLDSGMFSVDTVSKKYATDNGLPRWSYYDTPEFWAYVDGYAAFVKEHIIAIDLYANCDAIGNPEISWRNQKYLERKHGLNPVPVVHQGTDLAWLQHYIDRGKHEVIGLGWLTTGAGGTAFHRWLDEAFSLICPPPSRMPIVKIHGFGVTSFDAMMRYPWWSVDSASWTKTGAYGGVIIPHCRGGKWVYNEPPYTLWFTEETPAGAEKGKHFDTISDAEQKIVSAWLEEINVPLGSGDPKDEKTPGMLGVRNHHSERKIANLLYFERFRLSLPEWPWPYRPARRRRGFGLT